MVAPSRGALYACSEWPAARAGELSAEAHLANAMSDLLMCDPSILRIDDAVTCLAPGPGPGARQCPIRSTGYPALRHAVNPPSIWVTSVRPIWKRVAAASAERHADPQYSTSRRPSSRDGR